MKLKLGATFAGLVFAAALAQASPAYNDPSGAAAFNFGGNVGLDFTVGGQGILITQMGVYNALGDSMIAGTINVAIFDTSTDLAVAGTQVTFHTGYTQCAGDAGFDVCQAINQVYLAPGNYEVVAIGFTNGHDPLGDFQSTRSEER